MEISLESSVGIVNLLILIHIAAGFVGFVAGIVALIAKKGNTWHRIGGKVFFYTMLTAVVLALIISIWPGHESVVLFSIGLFTLYLVMTGIRALRFKRAGTDFNLWIDRLISGLMALFGMGMVFVAIWEGFRNTQLVTLAVFGSIALLLALNDLRLFRHADRLSKQWLRIHLTKMIGGFIAATTAFMVTNEALPGLWGWLSPTVLGSILIAFWRTRIRKGKFGITA